MLTMREAGHSVSRDDQYSVRSIESDQHSSGRREQSTRCDERSADAAMAPCLGGGTVAMIPKR
jgi:hypothetical protein